MFFHNLIKHANPWVLSPGVAAGSGDTQTSAVLDTAVDYAALFFITLGTVSTGGSGLIKVQGSADNGVADAFADIAGTGVTYTASNTLQGAVIDLYRPQKRYLQVQVIRGSGGNTVIASITALTYHGSNQPLVPGVTSTTGNIMNVVWLSNPGPGSP
jgi:hypothetical protein